MKSIFAISIAILSLAVGANAMACTSKNDCACWYKEHPDAEGCSICPDSFNDGSTMNLMSDRPSVVATVTGLGCNLWSLEVLESKLKTIAQNSCPQGYIGHLQKPVQISECDDWKISGESRYFCRIEF